MLGSACMLRQRLDGKLVIVTGSNTGIGLETAAELARRGARVIMACRSMQRASEARTQLLHRYGTHQLDACSINLACRSMKDVVQPIKPEQLICEELDLSSLDSVRSFASRVSRREPVLDILINNAGVMDSSRGHWTIQNFEPNMGINHLGHFLLTHLLMTNLKASSAPRIITVSSHSHYFGRLNPENLNYPHRGSHYAASKLANVIHARQLSKRFWNEGILAVSLHPGTVLTELFRQPTITNFLLKSVIRPFLKTPWRGAQTTMFCALTPDLVPGAYYSNCATCTPSSQVLDDSLGDVVWEASQKMLGIS